MVTLILAFAIARSRRLLTVAVTESIVARELKRFFDPAIAERIALDDYGIRPGQGVTRDAAILTVDVRGFSILAARISPDELVRLLTEDQSRLVPVIQDHGGNIDKFLGDGILASFGAVAGSATCAADALRAAHAVVACVAEWNRSREADGREPIRIGLAVAAGPVVLGAVGDESRLEFTVIGDTVNQAAKLEKHNKAEGATALTSAVCYELALAQGYRPDGPGERRSGRVVGGMDEPIDLIVLA
jgi:adenylate cyclase